MSFRRLALRCWRLPQRLRDLRTRRMRIARDCWIETVPLMSGSFRVNHTMVSLCVPRASLSCLNLTCFAPWALSSPLSQHEPRGACDIADAAQVRRRQEHAERLAHQHACHAPHRGCGRRAPGGICREFFRKQLTGSLVCRELLAVQIRGDAFVARIFDNDDTFLRKDFTLPEMDPSTAPWFAIAKAENVRNVQETFAMQHCRPTHARSRASNLCMCTHARNASCG